MKYLIFALFLSYSLNVSAQDNALVWQTDLMKAVDQSIKEKKPIFLFFTGSDWCGWCKRLQSEVFFQPEFQAWAKKNVILVELDFPRTKPIDDKIRQQNMEVAQIFGIRGYPTIVFATPSKKENQVNFDKIGSTGYVAGGPTAWLQEANRILASTQQQ